MNEIEAIRWHLDRYRALLTQQIDRLYNALEELQRTTLMLLEYDRASEEDIDEWLSREGFDIDPDGFFQSLPLLKAFREGNAPDDSVSLSWGRHLCNNQTARRHIHAHRRIGAQLKHLHDRLGDVGWIYYQDQSNTSIQFPYIDQKSAITWDFDWSAYHTYLSVSPENNPDRSIKWTPPTVDYAGEGLIISVSIPVWRDNSFVGLWSIDLPIRYLYRDFDSSKPFPDQMYSILDSNGILLLHERMHSEVDSKCGSLFLQPIKDLGGEWALVDIQKAFTSHDDDILRIVDAHGTAWVICHIHVPGVDWILLSGLPASSMDEAATQRLGQALRQIADGNFSYRIEPGSSNTLISTLTDEFNRMSLRLEEAESNRDHAEAQLFQAQRMESVGRLAGGVAHDYNNMLNVIMGFTELAFEKVDENHPVHSDLHEIYKAAKRSVGITRQLLAFARCQPVVPQLLDMNEAVKGMLKMLQRLIGENIELLWYPGEELWHIKIDPSQVDQVLANLCVNSRDAIVDVGKIVIRTENRSLGIEECALRKDLMSGSYVVLTVSDNGAGMDLDTQEKIFEPFYTTKAVGHGTGLGLSTVYGIVRQNNGFINVESVPGEGATFRIYFPRNDEKPAAINFESIAKAGSGSGETILIVEDDSSILKLAKKILEGLNYTVLASGTPFEAIEVAKRYKGTIDLLITDVIMPEMNGRDLAGEILAIYPELKVLFMSGYTADIIACRGVLDKDLNFIQKPFSIRDLNAKVRAVLN